MNKYNAFMISLLIIIFVSPLLLFVIDRFWFHLFFKKHRVGKKNSIDGLIQYCNIDNIEADKYLKMCSEILDVPVDYLNIDLELKNHPCGIPIDPVISIANYMEDELKMEIDEKALEDTKLKDVINIIIKHENAV